MLDLFAGAFRLQGLVVARTGDAQQPDVTTQLRRLDYVVEELRGSLVELQVRLLAWPAAALLFAALVAPLFRQVLEDESDADPDWATVFGLVSRASDVDNGAVSTLAVITGLALVAACALVAVLGAVRSRRLAIATAAAAGLVTVTWAVLLLLVGASEGGGAIDELGYESSARVLLVPAGAALALAASVHAQRARREAEPRRPASILDSR